MRQALRQRHPADLPQGWLAARVRLDPLLLIAAIVAWAMLAATSAVAQGEPVASVVLAVPDSALADHAGHAGPGSHSGHGAQPPASAEAAAPAAQTCSHCPMGHAHCTCAGLLPVVLPLLADGTRRLWRVAPHVAPAGLAVPPATPPPIA